MLLAMLSLRPRPWLLIATLALAGLCVAQMQTILIPVQSELPALLGTSREAASWLVTGTLLASAICTPIAGRLGDMYGKRRVAVALLSVVVVGSVVGATAQGVELLIAGRVLQGLGIGVIPLGIAILRDELPPERLGGGIALVSATLGVGGALGLPLSAAVAQFGHWRMLFWLSAAGVGLCLALYIAVVPPSRPATGGQFDLLGAAGLAAGLSAGLLVISQGSMWGWLSPLTIGTGGAALTISLGWAWWQMRTRFPLVDLRTSIRPAVLTTNIASAAMGFSLFAVNIVYPQVLALPEALDGFGLTLLTASLFLTPSGIMMLAMTPVSTSLMRRVGARSVFTLGAAALVVGYLFAVVVPMQVWSIAVVSGLIGAGAGLGYAAMPTLILDAVPAVEAAAANGLNTLMRAVGTTAAASLTAGILAQGSRVLSAGTAPSPAAFEAALIVGLAASVACTLLTLAIPHGKTGLSITPRPVAET